MNSLNDYSDEESVIIESDTNSIPKSSTSGGVLSAVTSSVKSIANSAFGLFVGTSSSDTNNLMDTNANKPPERPGSKLFRIYRSKNGDDQSDVNSSNIRKAMNQYIQPQSLRGIGRGLPTMPSTARPLLQSAPIRSPLSPTLSDPAEDGPRKCTCRVFAGPPDSSVCYRCKNERILDQPNSSSNPPILKIETPNQREAKRPRSDDDSVPLPPVLEPQTVTDKTIPETPPKVLEKQAINRDEDDKDVFVPVETLFFGNIPCAFRDVKLSSSALILSSVAPKDEARAVDQKYHKFNIMVPLAEVDTVLYHTDKITDAKGHHLFIKPSPHSGEKIMGTLKSTLKNDGHWLFDVKNDHEGVCFLYMKCRIEFPLQRFMKHMTTNVAVSNVNNEVCKKMCFQITSGSYKRREIEKQQKISSRQGPQRFSTTRSTPHRPKTSFTFDSTPTPPRATARMSSRPSRVTRIDIVELDDDDDDDGGIMEDTPNKRSTRSTAAAIAEPHVDPDEMLFVYPPDDPACQVQIYGRDLQCLAPQEYLNDNIIDFYLQYIMINSIKPEVKEKTHIFTTFFFTKLTGGKKEIGTANKSALVYDQVKKWLKKVDIFSKDYLVIPVNRSHHWFLVIVCNANNVQLVESSSDDVVAIDELEKDKIPCIIVMDSLGIVRTGGVNKLTNPIRYVLEEEWKHKKEGKKLFDHSLIPDRNIKPPLQDNSYDCGLFLIKYVECFLRDPKKVLGAATNKLGKEFLEVKEAKNLRKVIRKTIFDLRQRKHDSIVVESTSYGDNGEDDNSRDDKSTIVKISDTNAAQVESSPIKTETFVRNKSSNSESDMEVIEYSELDVKSEEPRIDLTNSITDKNETITSDSNQLLTDDESPIVSRRHSVADSSKDLSDRSIEEMEVVHKEIDVAQKGMEDENEDVSNKSNIIDISTEEESDSKKLIESTISDSDELTEMMR